MRARFQSLVMLVALSLSSAPAVAQKAKRPVKAPEPAPPAAVAPKAPAPVAPKGPAALADTLTGEAKADYESGKLLYGDGDYGGARVKFQAAYDLAKDPRLLWNMAVCEKGQRHYAKVVGLTQKYLTDGGELLSQDDRSEAKDLLDAIESFTVALTLSVNEAGAEVAIDGEPIGTSPLAGPSVVDIGTREISVTKPGFKPFHSSVPVGGQKQASLQVTLLAELHAGELNVAVEQGGSISIDGKPVGRDHFAGKLKSGGHTLRVEAPGMVPYQSEVVVQDNEKRRIDVVLEPMRAAAASIERHGPFHDMEFGFRTGYGSKHTKAGNEVLGTERDRSVGFIPLWLDIGGRLGRPTYLGLYLQYGWLNKSDTCGIARHGPDPTSPADSDPRFGYQNCFLLKAGVDVVFHLMPRTIVDPYFGFDVGVQGTFAKYQEYDPVTRESRTGNDNNASFQPGFQLGIDYHPTTGWGLGLFAHAALHFGSEGKAQNNGDNTGSCIPGTGPGTSTGCQTTNQCQNGDCDSNSAPGAHILFGTRFAYTFP
jgi:PEGA domain